MRLRPVFADILPDLKLAQLLDDPRTYKQRNHQSCAGGERRPKRQIPEDPERMKKRKQLLVKQPVKQVASNAGNSEIKLDFTGVRRTSRLITNSGIAPRTPSSTPSQSESYRPQRAHQSPPPAA
jgi:hypothetical protein